MSINFGQFSHKSDLIIHTLDKYTHTEFLYKLNYFIQQKFFFMVAEIMYSLKEC